MTCGKLLLFTFLSTVCLHILLLFAAVKHSLEMRVMWYEENAVDGVQLRVSFQYFSHQQNLYIGQ